MHGSKPLKPYLEAHDEFVAWLSGTAACKPAAGEVERKLRSLAESAAARGMSDLHWMFVVDGLIAHAKRRCPENGELPSHVARGLDFTAHWAELKSQTVH